MIIRRIHIRRFRKLVDQTLDCGPGLNVIHGRNDAGKSTLHLAFSAVLYPIRPSEVKTYGPWGNGDPGEITVEFEAGGCSYRLRKDLASRRVGLVVSGESAIEDPKHVEQRIGELLGLGSLSLFRATAHISQWDLAGVQKEQQEIGTRLARIVTGGDADAARVLTALEERIRRLEVGLQRPAKIPGPLKGDQDRLTQLASEQQRFGHEVDAIERAAVERDRLGALIGDLEQHVRNDEALLAANRRLLDLDREWKRASERATELESLLDRIAKAVRDIEAADRDDALRLPSVDLETLRRLQDAEARVRVLETPLSPGPAPPAVEAAPGLRQQRSISDRLFAGMGPAALGLAALVAGAGGVVLLAAGRITLGVAASAAAVLLAVVAAIGREQRARVATREAVTVARRQDLIREAEERRRAAQEAAREVERQLQVLGVPSLGAARDLAERRERARFRQETSHTLLSELLGGRTREEITADHQRVLLELGMIRVQREDPDLALQRLDPAGFQRLQAEAAARKLRLSEAQSALNRLEGRLSGRSPHEDLARVEEQIAETRARLARHQRLALVLKLTRAILFEAHRSTIVPGKAMLEERAGRYLRELSGGAYDRVVVDEHSLAPQVWVGPPKEWADVASREIGSGAVDQCYLALRLALVDVLCDDRRPPLFLDDPFLAYDPHRERAALSFLRRLARDRQIFLITCRGEYHDLADRLIELGEVSAPASAS